MLTGVEIFFAKLLPLFYCYVSSITCSLLNSNFLNMAPVISLLSIPKSLWILLTPLHRFLNVSFFVDKVITSSTALPTTGKLSSRLKLFCYKRFSTFGTILFLSADWWVVLKTPIFFQAKRIAILHSFVVGILCSYKFLPIIREFFITVCAGRHIHTSYANT